MLHHSALTDPIRQARQTSPAQPNRHSGRKELSITIATTPRTSWRIFTSLSHSNLNLEPNGVIATRKYGIAGFPIHRVTGMPYGEFLRFHFFEPLHMSTTSLIGFADIIPNRASGYEEVDGKWKNVRLWQSESTLSTAEGSLLMSVLDLAKWDAALNAHRLLKRASLQAMWKPVPLDDASAYPGGMGWFIANARGHRMVFHTGTGWGFSAVISRYVDDRLTIIIMSNIESKHSDMMKIAACVAAIYLPETAGANPIKDW